MAQVQQEGWPLTLMSGKLIWERLDVPPKARGYKMNTHSGCVSILEMAELHLQGRDGKEAGLI